MRMLLPNFCNFEPFLRWHFGNRAANKCGWQIIAGQGNVKYVVFDSQSGKVWERIGDEWKAVELPK